MLSDLLVLVVLLQVHMIPISQLTYGSYTSKVSLEQIIDKPAQYLLPLAQEGNEFTGSCSENIGQIKQPKYKRQNDTLVTALTYNNNKENTTR
jgi:hypothetical protein